MRLALTKGDACMWCSYENQTNFNGPPLSDGDALPFPTSCQERGAWLPAVRAGRVRDEGFEFGSSLPFSFLSHPLAAALAQENHQQDGATRRLVRGLSVV